MAHRTLDEYLKQTTPTTTKQPATKPKYKIVGFYKETEFQETPIGKIPKQWSITKLRNVTKINESKVNTANLGREVARIPMELIPDDSIYAKYVLMPINEIKSYVTAKAGDILLAKITPSFENGKQGIVPDDVPHGIALVTTEVYPITPINIERLFLFYILKWHRYRKLLEWKMTGTTGRRRVPKNALENLLIPLPPLGEQWGFAEVLSSLDRAIEATERLIGRLERLKRGLMQDLLTKGIGHREYKQTPIGKIPKQWKIVRLKDVSLLIRNGYTYRKFNREGKGIPVTRIETISNGKIDISKLAYVEDISDRNITKYKLTAGDILFSHINSEKHIGKTAIYEGEPKLLVHGMNLLLIRPNNKLIYPRYLLYLLRFYKARNIFLGMAKRAVNQASINQTQLSKLKVVLPPLEEQRRIVAILSSIDDWIELEKRRKEKFERLKRGLMELLLTGRVRVRVERVS